MADITNKVTLQTALRFRRDATFNSSYILEAGEPGFEVNTNTFKIGDGSTSWTALPIANEAAIGSLISAAITAHAAGYYTKDEVDAFIKTVTEATAAASAAVTAEAGLREAADIALGGRIDTVAEAVETEAGAREAGDNAINAKIGNVADGKTVIGLISEAESAAKSHAENKAAEAEANAKSYADSLDSAAATARETLGNRVTAVENKLANVTNVMDFVGAVDALPESTEGYQDGDVIVVKGTGKEYVVSEGAFVEFGYADGNTAAIEGLQTRMTTAEGAVEALGGRLGSVEGTVANKLDASTYNTYIEGKEMSDAELKKYAEDEADAAEAAAISHADTVAANKADAALATAKTYADQVSADAIASAKATSDAGDATTLSAAKDYTDAQLKANAVKIKAGNNDIEVTPDTTTGETTIAHKTYDTGTYTKTPESSSKTGDIYFFDSITTANGHITGGTMKSLASILAGMEFILDGGTSTN